MLKKAFEKARHGMLTLLRLSPSYFALLSGIFISTSVSLYTSVFTADTRPDKWVTILIAALLILISSFFWAAIAWNLSSVQTLAISAPPESVDEKATLDELILSKVGRLAIYLTLSVVLTLIGLIVLFL